MVISRLPVGHTHEDIDQKFSVVSRVSLDGCPHVDALPPPKPSLSCVMLSLSDQRLKGAEIITPQDFAKAVEGSFVDITRSSSKGKVGRAWGHTCTTPPSGHWCMAWDGGSILGVYGCVNR